VAFSGGAGVAATAWSPNGKLMATAFFSPSNGPSNVVIWNPATGAVVSSLSGLTGMASSVAWSADGAYVAATGYGSTIQVWNVSTRKVIFTQSAPQGGSVAWSPNGLQLVFASDANTFQVWDVPTQKQITSYSAPVNGALGWSPDGKAIAVASGNDVILWDAATGKLLYTYTQTGNAVRALAWSPNSAYIVSGGSNESGNNVAKVWTAAPLP
jgi:WD40 repeat protein